MKKDILLLPLITVLFVTAFIGIITFRNRTKHTQTTIAILQTSSHPALDEARESFIQTVKKELGSSTNFAEYNAQGSMTSALALAQIIHARNDISAIFTIATPATKAMIAAEQKRPIVFAAVSDPALLDKDTYSQNVTGSIDTIDTMKIVSLIKELTPHVKKIGILYGTTEPNSVAQTAELEHLLRLHNFAVKKLGITSESEIVPLLVHGLRYTDLIIAPIDNIVASTIDLITMRALQMKKPLIVSDILLVKYGALAAHGTSYKKSGEHAAHTIIKILKTGVNPSDLPITHVSEGETVINAEVASTLTIKIPKELTATATVINDYLI